MTWRRVVLVGFVLAVGGCYCQSQTESCVAKSFPSSSPIQEHLLSSGRGTNKHLEYVSTVFQTMESAANNCTSKGNSRRYIPIPYAIFSDGRQGQLWQKAESLGISNAQVLVSLIISAPPAAVTVAEADRQYCYTKSTGGQCTSCNSWFNDLFFESILRASVEVDNTVSAAGGCIRVGDNSLRCWEASKNGTDGLATTETRNNVAPDTCDEPWLWSKPSAAFTAANGSNPETFLSPGAIDIIFNSFFLPRIRDRVPVLTNRLTSWSGVHARCLSNGNTEWVQFLTTPVIAQCTPRLIGAGLCTQSQHSMHVMVGSSWLAVSLDSAFNITQCPVGGNTTHTDVFVGSATCSSVRLQANTSQTLVCEDKPRGFTPNTYKCACPSQTYLEDENTTEALSNGQKAYSALFAVSALAKSGSQLATVSTCLTCRPGCRTCNDFSPCLRQNSLTTRSPVLAMSILSMLAIVLTIVFVRQHELAGIIQSASPPYLLAILFAALLAHTESIVVFPSLNNTICALQPWCRHMGFMIMFGSLFGKVWRTQVLARMPPGSVQVTQLDSSILKFVFVCAAMMAFYLTLWTAVGTSEIEIIFDSNGNSYERCTVDSWKYLIHALEFAFLIFAFTVTQNTRKLVFEWGEYKFLVGTFINAAIIKALIATFYFTLMPNKYADHLYLLQFFDNLFTITTSLIIIFAHKIYMIRRDKSNRVIGPTVPTKHRDSIVETGSVQDVPLAQISSQRRKSDTNAVVILTGLGIFDVMFGCWMGPLRSEWSKDYYGVKVGDSGRSTQSELGQVASGEEPAVLSTDKEPLDKNDEDSGMPYMGEDT